jgi:hypothetical protein
VVEGCDGTSGEVGDAAAQLVVAGQLFMLGGDLPMGARDLSLLCALHFHRWCPGWIRPEEPLAARPCECRCHRRDR